MALTKEDKNFINETIDRALNKALKNTADKETLYNTLEKALTDHTRQLMIWMSQNFYTKAKVASKKNFEHLEYRVNNRIADLQDAVATLDDKFTVSIAMTDARVSRLKNH